MDINQILVIVGVVVAIGFIVSFIKGAIKTVFIVGIAIAGLLTFNKLDSSQIEKITNLSEQGITYVNQLKDIAEKSKDTVKIDTSNGYSISVKINGNWVDTSEIAKIKSISSEKCVIEIQGKEVEVTDPSICEVIGVLQDITSKK